MYSSVIHRRAAHTLKQLAHFRYSGMAERTRLVALVTAVDGEDTLTLDLSLAGRNHKMLRPQNEPLERTLRRVALTATKRKGRRGRDSKSESATPDVPVVRLLSEREEVPGSTLNREAWREGEELVVGEERFLVLVNCPAVKSLTTSPCVMAGGCPIIAEVELQFSDPFLCKWTWKRLPPATAEDASVISSSSSSSSSSPIVVSSSMIYWPSQEDIGHQLLVECTPWDSTGRRSGEPYSVSTKPVLPPPDISPIARRQLHTPQYLSSEDKLRVVSYNILADTYSTTEYAQKVLYPYCRPEALLIDYRQCLLVRELAGYHADILCLQEVGKKCFERFLLPAMRDCGYSGCFAQKTGQVLEGEATFFRHSKFKLVNSSSFNLTQFLMNDQSCSELHSALLKAPTVMQDLQRLHNIIQISLLQSIECPTRYICVANTHLYFHPAADHIRLIQAIICTRALQKTEEEYRASILAQRPPLPSTPHQPDIAVVFCGDFNSCPCIGAYQFLTKGSVESFHLDWTKYKMGLIPRCGCSSVPENVGDFIPSLHLRKLLMDSEGVLPAEEAGETVGSWGGHIVDDFAGLDVSHSFSLQDACGTHLLLPYTNFTLGFKCVLDYIFIDSNHLTVESAVPLPSLAELTENVALPSVSFPSDHLSLICDLRWKN